MVKEIAVRHNSSFEWDFVLGFLALLVIWLLVGHTLLINLATRSPLLAYGLFILLYSVMFFLLGQSMHQGPITVLVSLVAYFIIGMWSPPLMIPVGVNTTQLEYAFKLPLIVVIGTIVMILAVLFFIIANRLKVPFRIPITLFFLLGGMALLFFGLDMAHYSDPFSLAQCSEEGPQLSLCNYGDNRVGIPGNDALATDVFFYLIFRNILGFPHILAWIATYILFPFIIVVVLAIMLTRKQLAQTFGGNL